MGSANLVGVERDATPLVAALEAPERR